MSPIKQQGKLFFFCGKMGAGKSTASMAMAKALNAVLLSEDDWLAAHFPGRINTFEDYLEHASLVRPFIRALVANLLTTGATVVMDFPANTRRQRAWFLALSQECGVDHELVFLNTSDARCLAQIAKRRVEQPDRAGFDTEETFHRVTRYFEPPSDDEGLNIVEHP